VWLAWLGISLKHSQIFLAFHSIASLFVSILLFITQHRSRRCLSHSVDLVVASCITLFMSLLVAQRRHRCTRHATSSSSLLAVQHLRRYSSCSIFFIVTRCAVCRRISDYNPDEPPNYVDSCIANVELYGCESLILWYTLSK